MYEHTGFALRVTDTSNRRSPEAYQQAATAAADRYNQLRGHAEFGRFVSWLLRRPSGLLNLGAIEAQVRVHGVHSLGRVTVPLAAIRGSQSRSADFDAAFRPLQGHTRDRWIRSYAALELGDTPPPLTLIEVRGVYFVQDGHHRISTALAFGMQYAEAWVTSMSVSGRLPWETPSAAAAYAAH